MTDDNNNPTGVETPKVEDVPKVEETAKVEPPKVDTSSVEETLTALGAKVDELAASIAALSPLPSETVADEIVPDESPVKGPWTHRSIF